MVTNALIFKYKLFGFFLLLFGAVGLSPSVAQPVQTPKSMSLGGTGTTHIEGPAASFWNPANLMIRSRSGSFHLTIGNSALSLSPVLPDQSVRSRLSNFADSYLPYKPGGSTITERQRKAILQNLYDDNKLEAHHRQRTDLLLFGALWQRSNYAFSVALRGRYGSNNTVGRGWYDEDFVPKNGRLIRDFSLTQRRTELYELAFGYAQELTFINGLLPGLNKLYIGITPKFVAVGSHFSARYQAQYIRDEDNSFPSSFVSDFNLTSSGNNSRAINDYRVSGNAQQAINNNFTDQYRFKPTGYGLGFDFGLNYVIPLNSNASHFHSQHRTDQSLRIAFSLNDIGAVRFHDDFVRRSAVQDSMQIPYQPPVNIAFIGSGGQYITYLDRASSLPNPLLNATEETPSNKTILLPSSINAGILLDLNRFKFTGDLTLGLRNTAFRSNDIALHLGMELRPVNQIPIRLGASLAKEEPFRIGFGTGLETTHWDFTVSGQALLQQGVSEHSFAGGAFGGLQFHF